jgi:hypothetical protein
VSTKQTASLPMLSKLFESHLLMEEAEISTAALSSTKTIIEENVIWLSGWFLLLVSGEN